MESDAERSVKPKVTMEFNHRKNVQNFNDEFIEAYLHKDMDKKQAQKELAAARIEFRELIGRYYDDPASLRTDLSACEIDSLAHIDPEFTYSEEDFYYHETGSHPTIEEFNKNQPESGYLIRLPIGIKSIRAHSDPKVIKAYTDILGALMQSTNRPVIEHTQEGDFTSSMMLNVLTMNHGNYTKNPKLNGEMPNMNFRDRPITRMLMCNSAHILCLNEADAFFEDTEDKTREHPDVYSSWLQGHCHQILARKTYRMFRSRQQARQSRALDSWQDTFLTSPRIGEQGTEGNSIDPEHDIPTSDCLATTGTSMFTEECKKNHFFKRLPPRSIIKGYGQNKEIITIRTEKVDGFRGAQPKSKDYHKEQYDDRHVTRAGLPFATIRVVHTHPSISYGAVLEDFQYIMPLVTEYACDAITGMATRP